MNRQSRAASPWDDDEFRDDPLDEDLDRFEEGDSYCPHCGGDVWEDVAVCPHCRRAIDMPTVRPPTERWWRDRWTVVVVVAILLGLCGLGALRLFT